VEGRADRVVHRRQDLLVHALHDGYKGARGEKVKPRQRRSSDLHSFEASILPGADGLVLCCSC
jgi:hypothetical protein